MLLFEIANDSGYTRVGSPETLVLEMTYLAEKDSNANLAGFNIHLNVVTGAQGTVALNDPTGVSVPISGQAVNSQNPAGPQNPNVTPNHANDINIKQIHWNLSLVLEAVEGTPGAFTLLVSGPIFYTWILGEVDLDPSAVPGMPA